MTKLKPCPFCGGEAIFVKTKRCGRYVGCWDCGGRTEEFETDYTGSARDKAISAWSRRVEQGSETLVRCGECIKPLTECPFKEYVMLKTDYCSCGEKMEVKP